MKFTATEYARGLLSWKPIKGLTMRVGTATKLDDPVTWSEALTDPDGSVIPFELGEVSQFRYDMTSHEPIVLAEFLDCAGARRQGRRHRACGTACRRPGSASAHTWIRCVPPPRCRRWHARLGGGRGVPGNGHPSSDSSPARSKVNASVTSRRRRTRGASLPSRMNKAPRRPRVVLSRS